MLNQLDQELVGRITGRLMREGLVVEPAGDREPQLALSDLVERLRYALGEYATPPLPAHIEDPS